MLEPEQRPAPSVLAALPVFPLPQVVFFPGMVLPLNVFEPRYLALVDHVLRGGDHIGVPLLRPGALDARGRPVFEPIFGIGRLSFHRMLPDGRRFIRLDGIGRVKVIRELEDERLFRSVEVQALAEPDFACATTLSCFREELERLGEHIEGLDADPVEAVLALSDARVLSYAAASLIMGIELGDPRVGSDPREIWRGISFLQRCLEAATPEDRVALLSERCKALLRGIEVAATPAEWMN